MESSILPLTNFDPLVARDIKTPGKVQTIDQAKNAAREFTAQFLEILYKEMFDSSGAGGFLGDSHTSDTLIKPQWISVLAKSSVQGEPTEGLCKIFYESILKSSGLKDEVMQQNGAHYDESL